MIFLTREIQKKYKIICVHLYVICYLTIQSKDLFQIKNLYADYSMIINPDLYLTYIKLKIKKCIIYQLFKLQKFQTYESILSCLLHQYSKHRFKKTKLFFLKV